MDTFRAIGGSIFNLIPLKSTILPKMAIKEMAEWMAESGEVGTQFHPGEKIPIIAVPTTARIGSEATKNSVLSKVGENRFKKSLRHDNFVRDIAIVAP